MQHEPVAARIFPAYSHLIPPGRELRYSSSTLPVPGFFAAGGAHHFKISHHEIKTAAREKPKKTTLWEAFTNHLDSIYFPGAAVLLDKKLIAFECEAFKAYYV